MPDQILKCANYINGKWLQKGNGEYLKVFDKYSHTLINELPYIDENQMETAIIGASNGLKAMRKWSASEKANKLKLLHGLLYENKQVFVDLIVQEAGKPFSYATIEVERGLFTLSTAIQEAFSFGGESVPLPASADTEKKAFTKRFPVGIVYCVVPFNFPLNLLMHKIAPALAVGCSVIIKPPPQAPLTAIALINLISKVGYPDGAVNLVNCEVPIAEKLASDDRIAMLSFTGSAKVGWYLKNKCGKKKLTLELGGNAAVIVEDMHHLPDIAKTVAVGAYIYSGQVCVSTQRIYVNELIYDKFLELLIIEIKKLACGNPKDPKTIVGPIIDKNNFIRIKDWVEEAINMGAKNLTIGVNDEAHHILAPVLLTNTNHSMKVVSEEVFGPVAIIEKYKSFQDAIHLVNHSQYGLQAGVFTDKINLMKIAHEELEVGGVIINNVPGFRSDTMPYGGIKNSGLGREGVRYAMEEMTEPRLIVY